ncbi:DUF3037 domain-containing protein [Intestinibacter bartlettii]|uniref:DUF3037 domain-containing protein n=1 Tax=Intestinibacter bartlettii TaxID=261299 RepID=UPI002675E983|nr:DUF3037 domain-containing protein [Intestinibacter bartlettii]
MERKPVWYSIIRYSPDDIKGEIINVGLIMHILGEEKKIKYYIIKENSPKLKSIYYSALDQELYKSYREVLDFHLSNSMKNICLNIDSSNVISPYIDNFLEELYKAYKGKALYLSKPQFGLTKNVENLFNAIFDTYIGKKYLDLAEKITKSTKSYIKDIFENRKLLYTKVLPNVEINPINDLQSITLKIDFKFKNGHNNYIQTLPKVDEINKQKDWIFRNDYLFNHLKIHENAKINLLYRSSEVENDVNLKGILSHYLKNENITAIDANNNEKIVQLCDNIEEHAEDIANLA